MLSTLALTHLRATSPLLPDLRHGTGQQRCQTSSSMPNNSIRSNIPAHTKPSRYQTQRLQPPAAALRAAAAASNRPALFQPIQLRDVVVPNRIFLSPMCMYSATDGLPNDWHLVHLGARAAGGCGLVMAEATAVTPEGRISPGDTGLWNEDQVEAWKPITAFIRSQGAVPAIQLAHAGRKASTGEPTLGLGGPLIPGQDPRGWQVVGPSPIPFAPGWQTPREMTLADIQATVEAFAAGAKRALRAGFQVIELHMAHGYLLHEFLSPLSNRRNDQYGGSLENRMRLPLEVAAAVRKTMPDELPLLVRISATDWAGPLDGPAWDLDQSVQFVRALQTQGSVDLMDVSSGGTLARAPAVMAIGPGYQVPFSARIRRDTGVLTGAVGLITEATQAEQILQEGKADAIFLARAMLRDPHWALKAAFNLGYRSVRCPPQYERALK
ncbi:hypothetical protein Vretimale_10636 [Volvox reticuliferus]|uniref:NADH:flavin oxidoreductase/NADH oxidase N-terminal domain-containing protein n=1 Tax=Volvox reticuliferus TaxID=1737510 RepID=A0A8J4GG96_9CHLO|nr:hypothetical protein Vretifemale_13944 [Volvox reticuliferus]GIM06309.1 hypothetical protein Vretimale_10636 [Volvox reticuliferus]